MTSIQSYRGYAVHSSAHRLPDRTFSADVVLKRRGENSPDSRYAFYSLGYFPVEADAISYSKNWAREWIDTRG